MTVPKLSMLGVLALLFSAVDPALAHADTDADAPATTPYRRRAIGLARFGEGQQRQLLEEVRALPARIRKSTVGQDALAEVLSARLTQYIEGYGTRTKDPVALHVIGGPGIGKSSILDELAHVNGLKVFRFDTQEFLDSDDVPTRLDNKINEVYRAVGRGPTVLLLDEIDKGREIPSGGGEEKNHHIIGAVLNSLLSDGRVPSAHSSQFDLSNVLVVTTMNFDPADIQQFAREILGADKDYYDFTVEDLQHFDEWIQRKPGAVPKILSRLFRPNTVSRLAPNTIVAKSLSRQAYREIVRLNIERAIARETTGVNAAKRITASFDEELVDFLLDKSLNAPLGARDSKFRVDALVSQLISFGQKATVVGDHSIDQPRHLHLEGAPHGAVVAVTPKLRVGRAARDGKGFRVDIAFEPISRSFLAPAGMAEAPEALATPSKERLTGKDIFAARFPSSGKTLRGLAQRLDARVYGQPGVTRALETQLSSFVAAASPGTSQGITLAGFPGIGKSELVRAVSEEAGLPVATVNLQAFAGTDAGTLQAFCKALKASINDAKRRSSSGKIILHLEELDKVFELDPQSHEYKDRPIMSVIKDLYDKGIVRTGDGEVIDLRNAFRMVTMNFTVDRFHFSGDPRKTTIKDTLDAWTSLARFPTNRKELLGSMFLPETVSRISSSLHILRPLERAHYEQIIEDQLGQVLEERLLGPGGKDRGRIELALSPAYRKYLFGESVVPSEGGRNAATSSRALIARDLDAALKSLPRSSPLARRPLRIELDYAPREQVVSAAVEEIPTEGKRPVVAGRTTLYRTAVALNFPSIRATGRLEPGRLLMAIHEFGHALGAVRLGARFADAYAVPLRGGGGGSVRMIGDATAPGQLAGLYAHVASRAMERIFLSPNPRDWRSGFDITVSPNNEDVKKASEEIFALVYQKGLNPTGAFERDDKPSYRKLAELPHEQQEALGRMLRDIEDHLVGDFLDAHPIEWYREHIVKFARAGGMSEKAFYALVEYPHPGAATDRLTENVSLYEHFGGALQKLPKQTSAARAVRVGERKTTVAENLARAKALFTSSMKAHLYPGLGKLEVTAPSVAAELPRARAPRTRRAARR